MHLRKQSINNILAQKYNNIYIDIKYKIRAKSESFSFNYFLQRECMTFLHARHGHSFLYKKTKEIFITYRNINLHER